MKTCSKCSFIEDEDKFKPKTNICKSCISEYQKKYVRKNKDKIKKSKQEEYSRNKLYYKTKAQKYYQEHKDKLKTYSRKYRVENLEKTVLACIRWRKANPDKRIVYQHRREFNKKNNGRNDLTSEQVSQLRKEFTCCFYCKKDFGKGFKLTLDHVVPFSRGGQNTLSNIVLSCGPCNSSKGNRADIRKKRNHGCKINA